MKEYEFSLLKDSNMVCNDALSVKINGMKGYTAIAMITGFGVTENSYEHSVFSNDVGTVTSIVLIKQKNGIACTLKQVELK